MPQLLWPYVKSYKVYTSAPTRPRHLNNDNYSDNDNNRKSPPTAMMSRQPEHHQHAGCPGVPCGTDYSYNEHPLGTDYKLGTRVSARRR